MRDGYSRTDPMFAGWRQGSVSIPRIGIHGASVLDIVVAARSRGVIIRRADRERAVSDTSAGVHITFTNVEAARHPVATPAPRSDLLLPVTTSGCLTDRVVLWNHFTAR